MGVNLETISAEAKLLLTSLRLSSKPDATVVDDKDGIDGKLNLTSDGRMYYIATFRDPSNPFGVERTTALPPVASVCCADAHISSILSIKAASSNTNNDNASERPASAAADTAFI